MLLYWLWFSLLSGLTPWQKRELLQYFRDPEELYFCREEELPELLSREARGALKDKSLEEAQKIERQCRDRKIGILTLADRQYPRNLRQIADPPLVLYYRGTLPEWNLQPAIAVVGTRKATAYGLQSAYQMGQQIASCGGLLISGGAAGIDSEAMKGALYTGKNVICVLGCGVDVVYPRSNRRLFEQVLAQGCLISEYSPGEAPVGWHFPCRNRIISGLSHGILVVEAPDRSGALNTARHALEQGRDLYAVPGNIGVAACRGSNGLLREGAAAVITGWDAVKAYANRFPDTVREQILPTELPQEPVKVAQKPIIPVKTEKISIDNPEKSTYSVLDSQQPALNQDEQAIFALLTRNPQHSDEIAARTELPERKVQALLTKLTLRGLIQHHPGGLVSLK